MSYMIYFFPFNSTEENHYLGLCEHPHYHCGINNSRLFWVLIINKKTIKQ